MAISYYGKSQIAYFVSGVSTVGGVQEGISVINISELSNLPLNTYELVICADNYWEIAG